jgi:hypothetical protein
MNMVLTVNQRIGVWAIALIGLTAFTALALHGSIPQSQSYHDFADKRALWGIPNFLDVISNAAFVLVGLSGLYASSVNKTITMVTGNRISYTVFFAAVALVGLGSGYYHLSPSNASLVWDRLPMSIAIMALVAVVIGEFMSARLGAMLLLPLVSIGVLSVVYWHFTETAGQGDLRPYILVQFLPMIVIPVILVSFRSAHKKASGYWLLLSAYVLAKLCEFLDREIFGVLVVVSGHTLKHLAAAAGIYILLSSFGRLPKA